MALLFTFLALSVLPESLYASTLRIEPRAPANITWGPCPPMYIINPRVECATVQVPMDWHDAKKGDIPLSLLRLPAKTTPREGYMFVNPGGPGAAGTAYAAVYGDQLQARLGDGFDIVSWDPRGILESGPVINTFADDEEYSAYWGQYEGLGKINAHGNLKQSTDVESFMSQVSAFEALSKSLNEKITANNGDKLKYVGTCANIRDLVYLVDSEYGKGTDVNFWGISYGTVMGTYLTQLFPDRVGRVILDAVFDPDKHSNQPPSKWVDTDSLTVDRGLLMWAQACVAYPQKCEAAKMVPNATAEALLDKVNQILDTAHRNYNGFAWTLLGQMNQTAASIADSYSWDYLAANIRSSLYGATYWRVLDGLLPYVDQLQRNRTSKAAISGFSAALLPEYGFAPKNLLSFITYPIFCGDIADPRRETTRNVFRAFVDAAQRTSKLAPAQAGQNVRSHCHLYSSGAIERLPKSMKKKPKNIVLVIGNTGDPITPFQSARRLASSKFLGSQARLLQFNAPGHGAIAIDSTCVTDVLRKFVRGTPPGDARSDEADVICDADMTPYGPPPPAWKNSMPKSHN